MKVYRRGRADQPGRGLSLPADSLASKEEPKALAE